MPDTGKERHKCGLERIGQQDGLVIALSRQLPTQAPARAQPELAVTERHHQALADLGHALEDGQRPARREHVDGAFPGLLEHHEQALGHDHVAHPGRTDDEDLAHARVAQLRAASQSR
ncbi:hypothetical protein SDC9_136948 [bioreactor metagenome]|uniref:Uncharacterized protein n=1 Tax=bioreactor metagenome TaxID=1076179 RepID=A0A645DM24_9ZZZZ